MNKEQTSIYISHDQDEMHPVTLKQITDLAFSPDTPDEYADYLNYVLNKATECCCRANYPIVKLSWRIHENGAVSPFGEGGHPYCVNFYTLVNKDELPPFPKDIRKAR